MERHIEREKEVLTQREAYLDVYGAWLTYGLSKRTARDISRRDDSLKAVNETLSEEASKYLGDHVLHVVGGVERPIERREQIRMLALSDAGDVLVRRAQEEIAEKRKVTTRPPSQGMRVHIRREKAKQRGSDVRDIH